MIGKEGQKLISLGVTDMAKIGSLNESNEPVSQHRLSSSSEE